MRRETLSLSRRTLKNQDSREAKRREIMEMALQLLDEQPYAQITLGELAQRGELARNTLYTYFATKEALYLEILSELMVKWLSALDEHLDDLRQELDADALAALTVATLDEARALPMLLALLHQSVEHNIELPEATAFRRRLRDAMLPTAELLEEVFIGFEPGDGFRYLLWCQALIAGLYPMTHPSPTVSRALGAMDLAMFRMDFGGELHRSLQMMLRGWQGGALGLLSAQQEHEA